MKQLLKAILFSAIFILPARSSAQTMYPESFKFQGSKVFFTDGTKPETDIHSVYVAYGEKRASLFGFENGIIIGGTIVQRETGKYSDYFVAQGDKMNWMAQKFVVSGSIFDPKEGDEAPMVFNLYIIFADINALKANKTPLEAGLIMPDMQIWTLQFIRKNPADFFD